MTRELSDFIGRWVIEREIKHATAPKATLRGTATFHPDGDGALYHEVGALVIAGHAPMQSERRYRWDRALNVYFDDGRFFHTVPAMGGQTQHWCDPDRYDVTYDFGVWPKWSAVWRVVGPKKDYRMKTVYQKDQ